MYLQRCVAQAILIDGSKNAHGLEDFSVGDLDQGAFVSDEECFGEDLEWDPQKPVFPTFPKPVIPNFPGPTPGSPVACQPAVRLQEEKEIERVSEKKESGEGWGREIYSYLFFI